MTRIVGDFAAASDMRVLGATSGMDWEIMDNRESVFANSPEALLLPHMLGWSMNLFRVRGIQLSVHFSFFLLLAFFAQDGWQEEHWRGLQWNVLTLIAFFTCVVLHELGHSLIAIKFGIGV